MYTLYHAVGTASFAPCMVLAEAGLPHQVVEIDISAGEHRTPEYLALNPAGKVPALRLPDGTVLTEASAICLYLADQHQLEEVAPDCRDADRPLFLKSLLYLATAVQDHYKRYYYPHRYSEDPSAADGIRERALALVEESLQVVDQHLQENGPYHLGSRNSAADIYLLMLVTWHPQQDELKNRLPGVAACCDRVAQRPAIRAGLEHQTAISVGN